jgi:hypothetical protein
MAIDVISTIENQYGKPITVFKATHGVKTVTPKLSTLLMKYVADASLLTSLDLNRMSKYW